MVVGKSKFNNKGKVSHASFTKNRKEKELKTHLNEKASMLRKYAKLCKTEGIASDRVNLGDRKNFSPEQRKSMKQQKRRTLRGDPLASRAKQVANARETQQKEKKDFETERLLHIKAAQKERNQKRKEMLQRTKKGQPIFKNQINAILEKLQRSASSHPPAPVT